MSTITAASNISAPTQFLQVKNDVYMPTDDSAADQVGPCCACSTSWAPSRTGIRR